METILKSYKGLCKFNYFFNRRLLIFVFSIHHTLGGTGFSFRRFHLVYLCLMSGLSDERVMFIQNKNKKVKFVFCSYISFLLDIYS